MAQSLADLLVSLSLDSAKFSQSVKKSQDEIKGFSASAAEAGKRIAHLLEFEVVMHGAEKFYEFIHQGAEAADRMGKLAQSTGMGVEEFQRLAVAAKMSDLGQDGLSKGLEKLSRNMQKVDADSGDAAKAFGALGIEATNSDGSLRKVNDVFGDVADAFVGMEDGAGKTALAMMIFGKSGAELIPLLNKGRAGIDEFADGAQRAGKILTEDVIRGADEFVETTKRLQGSASALGAMVAASVAPAFKNLVDSFTEGATGAERLRDGTIGLTEVLKGGAQIALWVEHSFMMLGTRLGGIGAMIASAGRGDFAGIKLINEELAKDFKALDALYEKRKGMIWGPEHATVEHGLGSTAKKAAPIIPSSIGGSSQEVDEYWKALEMMRAEADALQMALVKLDGTKVSETVAKISSSKFREALGYLTPGEQDEWIARFKAAAQAVDDLKAKTDAEAEAARRYNEMMQEGARVTDAMRTPAETYVDTLARMNDLLAGGAITWETYGRALAKAKADMEQAQLSKNVLARDLTNGIQGIFENVLQGNGRIDQMFADLLIRLASKAAAEEIMLNLGFNVSGEGLKGFSGLLDIFSKLFGGAGDVMDGAGGFLGTFEEFWGLAGVGMAADGASAGAGQPFIIGERGPELFVPSVAGTIVPNDALGGVSVAVHNYAGARVSVDRMSPDEIRVMIHDEAPKAVAGSLTDPNSRVSRALSRHTSTERRR